MTKMLSLEDIARLVEMVAKRTRGENEWDLALRKSFYWTIPVPLIYDMERDIGAGDVDVGSLVDDIESLNAVLDGSREALPYHLTRIASILRYMGEELSGNIGS